MMSIMMSIIGRILIVRSWVGRTVEVWISIHLWIYTFVDLYTFEDLCTFVDLYAFVNLYTCVDLHTFVVLYAFHVSREKRRPLGIHKEHTPCGYRPPRQPSNTQQSMKPTFSFSWLLELGSSGERSRKLTGDPHVLCVD